MFRTAKDVCISTKQCGAVRAVPVGVGPAQHDHANRLRSARKYNSYSNYSVNTPAPPRFREREHRITPPATGIILHPESPQIFNRRTALHVLSSRGSYPFREEIPSGISDHGAGSMRVRRRPRCRPPCTAAHRNNSLRHGGTSPKHFKKMRAYASLIHWKLAERK